VHTKLVGERFCLGLVEIVCEHGVRNIGRGERPVLGTEEKQRIERFGDSRGHADFSQRTPSVFEEDGPRGFRASTVKPFNGGNSQTIPLNSLGRA
jgi:hypothetical protein